MMLRKPMFVVRKLSIFCLVGIALGVLAYAASAAELPAGTVINKANLDKVMNDTFQGKTIRSMLPPSLEYQIRNWALQMKLRHSDIPKMSKGFIEATKRYAKDIKFDPKTREVSGYIAGMPFPDISKDDPYAGDKVVWNWYYAQGWGNVQQYKHTWIFISADTGVERRQDWYWNRVYFKGRLKDGGKKPVLDDKILWKTLFFVTAPYDLKGVGLFTIRYDSSQLDDTWVYVKSVRRTRRLSGGAWVDSVDGLDMLYDDLGCINARPSWYKSWKVLSKKTILVVGNAKMNWVKDAPTLEKEFPSIDLKNWPHWNPSLIYEWEPREVWEIEGIPPSYHPYSRRVVYADTHNPATYIGEGYDKEGKLWKFMQYFQGPVTKANLHLHSPGTVVPTPNDDENTSMAIPNMGTNIDFKRRHASNFHCRTMDFSGKFDVDDVTLGRLEAAGK